MNRLGLLVTSTIQRRALSILRAFPLLKPLAERNTLLPGKYQPDEAGTTASDCIACAAGYYGKVPLRQVRAAPF